MAVCYMKCHSLVSMTASILKLPNTNIEKHEAALLFFFLSMSIDIKYDIKTSNWKFLRENGLLFHENQFKICTLTNCQKLSCCACGLCNTSCWGLVLAVTQNPSSCSWAVLIAAHINILDGSNSGQNQVFSSKSRRRDVTYG